MDARRRFLATAAGAALLGGGAAFAAGPVSFKADDDPEASPIWQKVRASVFAGRKVLPAGDALVLEAPGRAIDAAVVPIAIRSRLPQTPAQHVTALYLVIDGNPSPLGMTLQFPPDAPKVDIETRVRIDAYSHVRAIAETSDGRLLMTTRFVKASGGCSAPPGADAKAALATLGQMRFRVDGDAQGRGPVLAQLQVSHPNHSGLAMDQYTRQFTPAHYVRRIEISQAGKPVLSADVDFSLSENPVLRFWFQPAEAPDLRATVVDSQDQRFVGAQALARP